ncbi:Hpt domain-containing protein [Spirosoma gilvum]
MTAQQTATRVLEATLIKPVSYSESYQWLDINFLTELYGEDRDYAAAMFETFMESVLPEFNVLEQQIQTQSWEEVYQLAHKLRPPLKMIGLTHLETALIQVETMAIEHTETDRVYDVWQAFYTTLLGKMPLVQAEWKRYLTTPNL